MLSQSIKLASLTIEAGFPPGVINVLSGHGPGPGAALASHMDVRIVSFTGSLRTGRIIQELSAKSNMKNVVLELGGKSPAVVLDDADVALAAAGTALSVTFNTGQVCVMNSRIYVQEGIYDAFVEQFKKELYKVKIGDPLDPSTTMGPVADSIQFDTVNRYLKLGNETGKPVTLDEKMVDTPSKGFFVRPTVFTDTSEEAAILKEEVFGPVANIVKFSTDEEALAKANDNEYGLYAAVFTKDMIRAMNFATKFESGTVGINCTSPTNAKDMPFGGYKGSGVGREGLQESLDAFLEVKTVLIKSIM